MLAQNEQMSNPKARSLIEQKWEQKNGRFVVLTSFNQSYSNFMKIRVASAPYVPTSQLLVRYIISDHSMLRCETVWPERPTDSGIISNEPAPRSNGAFEPSNDKRSK